MNDGPKVFQVGKNEAFREKQVSLYAQELLGGTSGDEAEEVAFSELRRHSVPLKITGKEKNVLKRAMIRFEFNF